MICNKCKQEKFLDSFYTNLNGYRRKICRTCVAAYAREQRAKRTKEENAEINNKNYNLASKIVRYFHIVKKRARRNNLVFELTLEDFQNLPTHCPILGIPLKFNKRTQRDDSYSIDRIDNDLGYTRDNIVFISHKANSVKRNATIEELERILKFYKDKEYVRIEEYPV